MWPWGQRRPRSFHESEPGPERACATGIGPFAGEAQMNAVGHAVRHPGPHSPPRRSWSPRGAPHARMPTCRLRCPPHPPSPRPPLSGCRSPRPDSLLRPVSTHPFWQHRRTGARRARRRREQRTPTGPRSGCDRVHHLRRDRRPRLRTAVPPHFSAPVAPTPIHVAAVKAGSGRQPRDTKGGARWGSPHRLHRVAGATTEGGRHARDTNRGGMGWPDGAEGRRGWEENWLQA